MVEQQEQEAAAAIAADLAAAYELVCRARDCRAELGSAMEVDGQQGAADAAAVAGGIMEKVVQLEAKVKCCDVIQYFCGCLVDYVAGLALIGHLPASSGRDCRVELGCAVGRRLVWVLLLLWVASWRWYCS
jgi:hypothetical protein